MLIIFPWKVQKSWMWFFWREVGKYSSPQKNFQTFVLPMKPIRRRLYVHLEKSCFFIAMLILYLISMLILIQENITFIDAYHIPSHSSSYLDSTWINLLFVSRIHSVQWLEICASPHEFQVNKGKSFSLTGVGCLRTTEDLYSETMRMEMA